VLLGLAVFACLNLTPGLSSEPLFLLIGASLEAPAQNGQPQQISSHLATLVVANPKRKHNQGSPAAQACPVDVRGNDLLASGQTRSNFPRAIIRSSWYLPQTASVPLHAFV
jgi:hypothetical protein